MSCCNCLKIQILDPITGMPDRFLQDGRLYLDLVSETALELSKAVQKLSVLDQIDTESASTINLPFTPKNDIIARFVRNHNLIGNDYPALRVLVQEGSITHHAFSELQFTDSSEKGANYTAILRRGTAHWADGAIEKYLNTVDFGTFEFTQTNLESNWANDEEYSDGDQGVYFPLVHYGGWIAENTILVEDFRPWFHVLSILQKGFCEIGWSFRSPVLETKTGRQLGCYILREDFGFNEQALESRKFFASSPTDNNGKIIFTTEDFDNSNSYSILTGEYTASMEGFFIAAINVEGNSDGGQASTPASITVEIVKVDTEGNLTQIAGERRNLPTSTRVYDIELKGSATVANGESVFVQVTLEGDGSYFVNAGYFTNDPKRVLPQKGDILELNAFVHPDYTLLDFLKGISHCFNGRFVTDWINKTVWLYTPYDAIWYTENVDGFYTYTIEDITELTVPNSEEITLEKTAQARYVQLQYKNSSDAYIGENELETENPLYYKEIDLGEGFIEETQKSENPFFEPTTNAVINKFPAIAPETVTYNVDIPHLWDNTEGKISYKIAPRLVLFFGYIYQIYDDGGIDVVRKWRLEGSTESQVPYALQSANSKYSPTALGSGVEITTQYGAYGGTDTNDFYNLAYARELLTRKFSNRSSFDMLVNAQRYRNTDFRGLYRIYHNGRTFFTRMLELFRTTCSNAPSLAIMQPEPFVGDICADTISVLPDSCQNTPRIAITVDLSGNYIAAEADDSSIDSPIASESWEYSTNDGASWTSYTPPDQISGFEEVIFRREVSFSDGCPTKVVSRTGSFSSACNNNPGIEILYSEGTNTATASGTGSFNSTIDSDIFEVSIDGAAYISYTENDPVTDFETVTFRRTTTYTNACPQTQVTATYTVTGTPCNNSPEIVFTQIGNSKAYNLSIGGTISSTISLVSFQISDNGGTTWRHHLGELISRYPSTKVRAVVYYADDCPASIIEADCT